MAAQLVNFVLLVIILGKFAYKPVIELLDKRRKKIEDGLAFAEKSKAELASIEVTKAQELKKAELRSVEIIKEAEVTGDKLAAQLALEGEADKQAIVQAGRQQLQQEKARLEKNFFAEATMLVGGALVKVLGKKNFDDEERSLIEAALKEVKAK